MIYQNLKYIGVIVIERYIRVQKILEGKVPFNVPADNMAMPQSINMRVRIGRVRKIAVEKQQAEYRPGNYR